MGESTVQRKYPAQPLCGVGAVVLWSDRVLLVQRLHPPLAGYWSVPGGLVELGETAAEAARREVREETGLEIEVGPVLTAVDRIERDAQGRIRYHYLIVDFLARIPTDGASSAPPRLRASSDARAAGWVAWPELDRLRLSPGLREVLSRARGE